MILSKINPGKILSAHLGTLHTWRGMGVVERSETVPAEKWDLFGFYFIPLFIGGFAAAKLGISSAALTGPFIASFSIFAGLLLNLQVLILNLLRNKVPPRHTTHGDVLLRIYVLRQTYANIAYAIVVAVAVVVIVFVRPLISVEPTRALIPQPAAGFFFSVVDTVVFALVLNFLLTLLMILKRVHDLFQKELIVAQLDQSTETALDVGPTTEHVPSARGLD